MAVPASPLRAQEATAMLELSRPVRSWEFLPVVGRRAGLFGNETGRLEAWGYSLKIFRDFNLTFPVGGRALPAESLVRTLTVRPESAILQYAGDSFRVRETLFVPVHECGAVILLDIETEQPLEVEASFVNDFQFEWPAALGGTYVGWDEKQRGFIFGEETRKFAHIAGWPTGDEARPSYQTHYSSSHAHFFRLRVIEQGKATKHLVMPASVAGHYRRLHTY